MRRPLQPPEHWPGTSCWCGAEPGEPCVYLPSSEHAWHRDPVTGVRVRNDPGSPMLKPHKFRGWSMSCGHAPVYAEAGVCALCAQQGVRTAVTYAKPVRKPYRRPGHQKWIVRVEARDGRVLFDRDYRSDISARRAASALRQMFPDGSCELTEWCLETGVWRRHAGAWPWLPPDWLDMPGAAFTSAALFPEASMEQAREALEPVEAIERVTGGTPDKPVWHPPHVCLTCGGPIAPEQPEVRVPFRHSGARYQHADAQGCAAASRAILRRHQGTHTVTVRQGSARGRPRPGPGSYPDKERSTR